MGGCTVGGRDGGPVGGCVSRRVRQSAGGPVGGRAGGRVRQSAGASVGGWAGGRVPQCAGATVGRWAGATVGRWAGARCGRWSLIAVVGCGGRWWAWSGRLALEVGALASVARVSAGLAVVPGPRGARRGRCGVHGVRFSGDSGAMPRTVFALRGMHAWWSVSTPAERDHFQLGWPGDGGCVGPRVGGRAWITPAEPEVCPDSPRPPDSCQVLGRGIAGQAVIVGAKRPSVRWRRGCAAKNMGSRGTANGTNPTHVRLAHETPAHQQAEPTERIEPTADRASSANRGADRPADPGRGAPRPRRPR